MQELNQHIEKLKNMTTERQADFQQVFNYFLIHIGENNHFKKCFKFVESHEILKPVLAHLGKSVYGNTITIANLILLHSPEQNFFHGTVLFSNGFFWGLYFFEDILSGIACNVFSNTKGNMDCYRLELFMSDKPPEKVIPLTAPSSSSLH